MRESKEDGAEVEAFNAYWNSMVHPPAANPYYYECARSAWLHRASRPHPPKVEAAPDQGQRCRLFGDRMVHFGPVQLVAGERCARCGGVQEPMPGIDPKPVERANAYGVVTDCATHVDRPDIPTLRDAWLVAMAREYRAFETAAVNDNENLDADLLQSARVAERATNAALRAYLAAVDGKS
jgi:hypothetical protein